MQNLLHIGQSLEFLSLNLDALSAFKLIHPKCTIIWFQKIFKKSTITSVLGFSSSGVFDADKIGALSTSSSGVGSWNQSQQQQQ